MSFLNDFPEDDSISFKDDGFDESDMARLASLHEEEILNEDGIVDIIKEVVESESDEEPEDPNY